MSIINISMNYADHSNAGGRVERFHSTAGMNREHRSKGKSWIRLKDEDVAVKKFKRAREGDASAWGKAVAKVDCSAEEALAFCWHYTSNLRMKEHQKQEGNLLRRIYRPSSTPAEPQNHTQHVVVRKSMPPPHRTRETNLKMVWGKVSNILVLAIDAAEVKFQGGGKSPTTNTSNHIHSPNRVARIHPTDAKSTQAEQKGEQKGEKGIVEKKSKGVWLIKSLAENVCEVVYVVTTVNKGKMPTSWVNYRIRRLLNASCFMRDFYERNGEVVDKEVSERALRKTRIIAMNPPK